MARMRRGRKRDQPTHQCDICNRITAGPQKGKHPHFQVYAADKRGMYRTPADAEAAGVDAQRYGVSHGQKGCPYCEVRLAAIENESRRLYGNSDEAKRYRQNERTKLIEENARYRVSKGEPSEPEAG